MNKTTEAVAALQDYWKTYTEQTLWEEYGIDTVIDDALYGIGIALDGEKYRYASGYAEFLRFLADRIKAMDDGMTKQPQPAPAHQSRSKGAD